MSKQAGNSQVRRDRVGVLASIIVKELATARMREIEREDLVPPDPPIVPTAQMKRLADKFAAAKRAKREATESLAKLGYVFTNDYDDERKVGFGRPYVGRDARKDQAKKARAARLNRIREMRTEALIDLVTLDPVKAKDAVRAFRLAIEQV